MFDAPAFEISKVLYTTFGVFFVWASWGKGRLSVKYLNNVLAKLGLTSNALLLVEFAITMSAGVVFAIALTDPQTAPQAIAAGMGWTGLIARPTDAPSGGQQ
jgi:uncharacterized membrane protein YbjE (DUF340 family)